MEQKSQEAIRGNELANEERSRMATRRRTNTLLTWEVALVKAMIEAGKLNDQDILSYFTRPTRSVNHRLIGEIRTGAKHKTVIQASQADIESFLSLWPDLDPETGLNNRGDELLIKAREAMIAAVQTFNSAGLTFRAELFIVTAIIAWTYLLHAWFKREGISYVYPGKTTPRGAERYWDLAHCLKHEKCPAKAGVAKNLDFLIELRHEIEHRSTTRIDDDLGAKLQACALNFNDVLKSEFGNRYSLERRLPIALQFVTFGYEQRSALKKASSLPKNIGATIDAFEHGFTEDQIRDHAYQISYEFVPVVAKKAGSADIIAKLDDPSNAGPEVIPTVVLKEVHKKRYPPKKVLAKVASAGFPKFKMQDHTNLWKKMGAKKDGKGFGCTGDYKNSWVWFERWIEEVIAHCNQLGDRYR